MTTAAPSRNTARFLAPVIALVIALVAALALAGCSSPQTFRIRPIDTTVRATPGTTLVMPVEVNGPISPSTVPRVRLDDGRLLPAELWWIGVGIDPGVRSSWLPPRGDWTALPVSTRSLPDAIGAWSLVFEVPIDAVGQGLWLEGQRTRPDWLPRPDALSPADVPERWIAWASPLDAELRSDAGFAAVLEPERASPVRQWRAAWALDTLAPSGTVLPEPGRRIVRTADNVLDAVAEQRANAWRVAIASLWLADAQLARELAIDLVAVVRFDDGPTVPAWESSQPALDSLLGDMLAARNRPDALAAVARAWLRRSPDARAWVVDDQRAESFATIGIATLTGTDDLVTLAYDEAGLPDDVRSLPAMSADTAAVPVRDAVARVRIGSTNATLPIASDAIPARPPALSLGRLLPDWTLAAWRAGDAALGLPTTAAQTGREATASLDRIDNADGTRAWRLIIRCDTTAVGSAVTQLIVRIGPAASPLAQLVIDPLGGVRDELAVRTIATADVARDGNAWTAVIQLPIASDAETLQLGIERIDVDGSRRAWPRRMMPWQIEPGRLKIDLAAWDER